ncbi:hypothetical protein [Massilia sp. METH4]|uniref:DUF7716 domain-containing protein n=1 Tax=Massilia sp. METH4 TaxID=3123041 RepID=UPI0030CC057E
MLVKLKDVLVQEDRYSGWFYLPDQPWTLETEGIFAKRDKHSNPGSDDHIPAIVDQLGASVTIDAAGIEDVICNAKAQIDEPTPEQLLEAFTFYVDNDAFIEF